VAERGLTEMIRFGLSEFWTEDDARDAAIIIRKVAEALA